MAKYKVKVYYEYAVEVEVDGDTMESAYDKAFEIAGARRLALASGKARFRPVQNGLTEEKQ